MIDKKYVFNDMSKQWFKVSREIPQQDTLSERKFLKISLERLHCNPF